MRKRSKYRPKGVLPDTMAYVTAGFKPIAEHNEYLLDLRIKNHEALMTLTRGKATRQDLDVLITAFNIVEALYRLGFGDDYKDVVAQGLDAVRTVAGRGVQTNKFVLRAEEMHAINLMMELHDAQLDIITVRDMEQAIKDVEREYRSNKMVKIPTKGTYV